MNTTGIWIALLGCALSCYFAACHIALMTFSRKRLGDLLDDAGRSDRFEPWIRRVAELQLFAGMMRAAFGLVVVLATVYEVESRAADLAWPLNYALSFIVAGGLLSIFSVVAPASWACYRRERLLAWSLPILNVLLSVFMPLLWVWSWVDPVIRRISGVDLHRDDESDISDEVLSVVEEHEGGEGVDEEQKDMLEAVFELPTTDVGEIMTPRTDIEGIALNSTLEQAKDTIIELGHSRIPVYEKNLDHIVGILYAKDLIQFVGNGASFDLRQLIRDAYLVPESKSVRELLADFKSRKVHMAIVLDEYGGTAGLVTIEDIIEEIVGEIQDEYESQEEPEQIQRIDQHAAEVDARLRIDDLNDYFDAELPEDEDYDTVGGFVFAALGHIPDVGETFKSHTLCFTVTAAERTKVLRVKIERMGASVAQANP